MEVWASELRISVAPALCQDGLRRCWPWLVIMHRKLESPLQCSLHMVALLKAKQLRERWLISSQGDPLRLWTSVLNGWKNISYDNKILLPVTSSHRSVLHLRASLYISHSPFIWQPLKYAKTTLELPLEFDLFEAKWLQNAWGVTLLVFCYCLFWFVSFPSQC